MFVDKRFINKAQFNAGFAHPLILKYGAVPAIKKIPVIQNCRSVLILTAVSFLVLVVVF